MRASQVPLSRLINGVSDTIRQDGLRWLSLLAASFVLALFLQRLHVNGAFFLAPMLVGIVFAFAGSKLKIASRLTIFSQGVIGCVLARSLDQAMIAFVFAHWFALVAIILITMVASLLASWLLVRLSGIDRETAAWGCIPGAAGLMVTLAADGAADVRLVAFMQYVRLILVVASASLISGLFAHVTGGQPTLHMPPPAAAGGTGGAAVSDMLLTLAVALGGIVIGQMSRIPAGPLLVTTVLGAAVHATGFADLTMPTWLSATAYALVGLFVGLQFDRQVLRVALSALPAISLSMACMAASCGLAGVVLAGMLGIDPLTGYLATSPGGIDSIAIIALDSHVDISVVLAVQTVRFFAVIMIAPFFVRFTRYCLPGGRRKDVPGES